MKTFLLKISLLSITLLSLPFLTTSAQIVNTSVSTNLSISINPKNPSPGDQVIVALQSFSFDLNRSKITWSVDGVKKVTELGLKSYYLQAGQAGTMMTVSAEIEAADSKIFNKEISFIPAGVDLLFEVISYTPPFYKGKAMNTNQGEVVVVAFPEMFDQSGRKLTTKELIYSWKKDGAAVASASGAGKNYFTFSGTVPIRDNEIEVLASSLDQSIVASKKITIKRGSPKIVFYENSPIYGIMNNKAISSTVQLLTDEFSVIAVPYFFTVGYAGTPDLDYAWSMNGKTISNQEPKNSLTVRQENPGSGIANIALKISNKVRIFQFTNNSYTINFQKQ